MPTRKIDDPEYPDIQKMYCQSPDHQPPTHMVYEPGVYEHVCCACGLKFMFRVPLITCRGELCEF